MAFRRPAAAICLHFGLILGDFWGHFADFFADAAKVWNCNPSQAKRLFSRVPGLHFCILFATFLHVFLDMLPEDHFLQIFWDFGLQLGSLWEALFAYFADLAWKKGCWNWGLKNDDFWETFGRGRRQGAGSLKHAFSAESALEIQHALQPLRGCGES